MTGLFATARMASQRVWVDGSSPGPSNRRETAHRDSLGSKGGDGCEPWC